MGDRRETTRWSRHDPARGTRTACAIARGLVSDEHGGGETVQAVGLVALFGAVLGGLVLTAATPVGDALGNLFQSTVAAVGFEDADSDADSDAVDPETLTAEEIEQFSQDFSDVLPTSVQFDGDTPPELPDSSASSFVRSFEDGTVLLDPNGNAVTVGEDGTQYRINSDATAVTVAPDGTATGVDLSSLSPTNAGVTSTGTVVNADNQVVTGDGTVVAELESDDVPEGTPVVVDPGTNTLVAADTGQVLGQPVPDVDLSGIVTTNELGLVDSPAVQDYLFDPYRYATQTDADLTSDLGVEDTGVLVAYDPGCDVCGLDLDAAAEGQEQFESENGALVADASLDTTDVNTSLGGRVETTNGVVDDVTIGIYSGSDLSLDDAATLETLEDNSGIVGFWSAEPDADGNVGGIDLRIDDTLLPEALSDVTGVGSLRLGEDGNLTAEGGVSYQTPIRVGERTVVPVGVGLFLGEDGTVISLSEGVDLGTGETVLFTQDINATDGTVAFGVEGSTDVLGFDTTAGVEVDPDSTTLTFRAGDEDGTNAAVGYSLLGDGGRVLEGEANILLGENTALGLNGSTGQGGDGSSANSVGVNLSVEPIEDLTLEAGYEYGNATTPLVDGVIDQNETGSTFSVGARLEFDGPADSQVSVGTGSGRRSGGVTARVPPVSDRPSA